MTQHYWYCYCLLSHSFTVSQQFKEQSVSPNGTLEMI